jgi:hypothetical protein
LVKKMVDAPTTGIRIGENKGDDGHDGHDDED